MLFSAAASIRLASFSASATRGLAFTPVQWAAQLSAWPDFDSEALGQFEFQQGALEL